MSFFVTAIAYYPESEIYDNPCRDNRTFGHFPYISDAMDAVTRNVSDMSECLYNYLVVEEIGYGIHALVAEDDAEHPHEWWYEYDDHKQQWFQINKPDWSIETTNWAIG